MKNMIKIVSLLTILFFTGCALGPDFEEPVVESPDKYRLEEAKADSLTNLEWWQLFSDPVLDTLVQAALTENKDLRIAASRIEEARANLGFTKADIYPRLDIQAGASRGNFTGGFKLPDETNNFSIAAPLTWEIDFWGKFRRSNEAAKAEFLSSQYSLRTVQISLISEVVGTYFLLLDFEQRLEVSKHTLESRKRSLDIIQMRYNEGIIPEIDVNQAQIQLEIAVAAIPIYKRQVAKTENALSILLGRLPDSIQKGKDLNSQTIPPKIPSGIPAQILERRPDIQDAKYRVQAQNARIGVAEAMRFPSISLTGIFGAASDDLSTILDGGPAWSITGSLFGPLFNFNKNTLRVEIEEERTKQAMLRYELVVLNAFREVEDALVEVKTFNNQLASLERRYKAASNAAKLSKIRYDKGVTSYLEVLDTERTLFNAELELSEVRQNYLSAYIKVYKSLGGGWISRKEKEDSEQ